LNPRNLLARLEPHHVELLGQLVRYVFTGGLVTVVHLGIYWGLAQPMHIAPLVANVVAQAFSTTLGYNLHSRWSFRGHGTRDNLARTGGRFLIVTAIGFGLNSFWVWLFTGLLHGAVWWPMPAMAIATPLIVFWLNRRWVFG
jgi:putative flippase GtrA